MSFGTWRGKSVYLMHVVRNKEDDSYVFPLICRMKHPIPQHYNSFLGRKTQDGAVSQYLILNVDGDDSNYIRDPINRHRYIRTNHKIVNILDGFKKLCKMQIGLKKLRARRRSQVIREELIMKAYHPDRIQRWLDMGYDLDAICEL